MASLEDRKLVYSFPVETNTTTSNLEKRTKATVDFANLDILANMDFSELEELIIICPGISYLHRLQGHPCRCYFSGRGLTYCIPRKYPKIFAWHSSFVVNCNSFLTLFEF